MSRMVDEPYFTYSAYSALTTGIQVKCPKCHGAGVVTALIAQRPEAQGYRGVMALCEWLVERRRPETTVNHMPIDILLKENIQYYKNNLI